MKSNASKCFICNKDVLEIIGQFQNFKPYGYDIDFAIKEGAVGKCHSICLENSIWGEYWLEKTHLQLTEIQKYKCIEINDFYIYYRKPDDDCYVMNRKGAFIMITLDQLKSAKKEGEFSIIKKKSTFSLEFNSLKIKESLMSELMTKKKISLKIITDELGITDVFHSFSALDEMELIFSDQLAKQCFGNWISGLLLYNLKIDSIVADTLLKVLQ